MQILRRRALEGLRRRQADLGGYASSGGPANYETRLEAELQLTEERRLGAWFLALVEHVEFLRSRGTPWHPGWGSAPGSLLLHALGATDIDPIPHGLVFERFIGPDPDSKPHVTFIVPPVPAIPSDFAMTWADRDAGVPEAACVEDLVATFSLQRPAPEEWGVSAEYARRRSGGHRAAFPELDGLTARTRGLVLYDEQIILAIADRTGWSRVESEAARREMARPRDAYPALREKFIRDATERAHRPVESGRLFDHLAQAARTAIQKCHHVAMAIVASRSARRPGSAPSGSMSVT